MRKTWLFLDFDNTLMATEQYAVPTLIARFNELYAKAIGKELTFTEFKNHFHGQARETLCDNLSKYFNVNVDYVKLYDSREWRIMQHLQQLPEGVPMAPQLIEILNSLVAKNVVLALVSNNPIQRALAAMRYAANGQGEALAKLFGTRFFEAGEVQKPKPEVYLRAQAQLKADPEYSFAVEDSLTGASSAIAAHLKTFAFTGFADDPETSRKKLLEKGCIAAFHHWEEFLNLMNERVENNR